VINGHEVVSSAGNPHCKIFIVMGKTDDAPSCTAVDGAGRDETAGLRCCATSVFGYDDTPWPYGDTTETMRVPISNILLGEAAALRLHQVALGQNVFCMRSIGAAERALEMMCDRLQARIGWRKPLAEQSV
jgi:acyl-CoA dehydrogenase